MPHTAKGLWAAAGAMAAATAVLAALGPLSGALGLAALCVQTPAAAAALLQNAEAAPTRGSWRPQMAQTTPTAAPSAAPSPSLAPSAAVQPTTAPTPQPTEPLTLDARPEGMGRIESKQFLHGSGSGYVELAAGSIRNLTQHTDAELREAARGGLPFTVSPGSDEPQVLILHTHATECYQPWDDLWFDPDFTCRSSDVAANVCAVGARMAEVLNAAGIYTLHDETLHDAPGYTESYARSAETAARYLAEYPSIQIILDVHRDAIEQDGARIRPLTSLSGTPAAQVMIISGCSNGSSVNLPHWRLNLQFAAAWEAQMETSYPTLTRPVLCAYRNYNQDLTAGCLLLEVGGHANTLPQAIAAGEAAADALAQLLNEQIYES